MKLKFLLLLLIILFILKKILKKKKYENMKINVYDNLLLLNYKSGIIIEKIVISKKDAFFIYNVIFNESNPDKRIWESKNNKTTLNFVISQLVFLINSPDVYKTIKYKKGKDKRGNIINIPVYLDPPTKPDYIDYYNGIYEKIVYILSFYFETKESELKKLKDGNILMKDFLILKRNSLKRLIKKNVTNCTPKEIFTNKFSINNLIELFIGEFYSMNSNSRFKNNNVNDYLIKILEKYNYIIINNTEKYNLILVFLRCLIKSINKILDNFYINNQFNKKYNNTLISLHNFLNSGKHEAFFNQKKNTNMLIEQKLKLPLYSFFKKEKEKIIDEYILANKNIKNLIDNKDIVHSLDKVKLKNLEKDKIKIENKFDYFLIRLKKI